MMPAFARRGRRKEKGVQGKGPLTQVISLSSVIYCFLRYSGGPKYLSSQPKTSLIISLLAT